MVSSTPPKGWIGKPPGSFEEPQRGRQPSLTVGNPPGTIEEPQRRRQPSLTMGNTQPPTTWQGPSPEYEGPLQDPGQFNASRPLLVQQAMATSSSSQRPQEPMVIRAPDTVRQSNAPRPSSTSLTSVGDSPQQVAPRSPPNYFQQRPQDTQGYSSNMQEINQEIEAALAIPVEYSCYPPLGKVPASVINYLWPATDYNKVASYKNRSEWMQEVIARVPTVTYEIFNQARDRLYEILYKHGPVHAMAESTLHTFLNAMLCNNHDLCDLIKEGKSFDVEGKPVWMLKTKNFPGAHKNMYGEGSVLHWVHSTNPSAVFGILKSGRIFPSCSDGIMLPNWMGLAGFFARIYVSHELLDAERYVKLIVDLAKGPKNTSGILFSGVIQGPHTKVQGSNTWREQFLTTRAGIVHSKASDKRWCIRTDLAEIQWIFLVG